MADNVQLLFLSIFTLGVHLISCCTLRFIYSMYFCLVFKQCFLSIYISIFIFKNTFISIFLFCTESTYGDEYLFVHVFLFVSIFAQLRRLLGAKEHFPEWKNKITSFAQVCQSEKMNNFLIECVMSETKIIFMV